ncbi:hypothetical protein ASG56_05860 [Rhodococcus sp. Leaf7]|uniref:polysaccharide deacetylase family protein n=1 Tax=unclassified Rhodococcus (in: high G+C Gram-positive bacteria) TaxID=192944 RepID=UPI0006FFCC64|nr:MULTISPECIES: polysaccharide deacetylase family protein [unclassified Rhodococcus (in: high G+C Gram-positive bacteria)]KQU07076.1 hypothetical protein ASG56_05860 [Rhodococcus sp. Leaf7]KQU42594.1 hypothetical protein ASG64_05860 [Rhodococcus sp. Leaf247]
MTTHTGFWPDGARTAVTVSMQFEAGGQPISGAGGPITEPVLAGLPDLGQNSFYEYGAREGVPRILDLLDKHSIPMTSFMIGGPRCSVFVISMARDRSIDCSPGTSLLH